METLPVNVRPLWLRNYDIATRLSFGPLQAILEDPDTQPYVRMCVRTYRDQIALGNYHNDYNLLDIVEHATRRQEDAMTLLGADSDPEVLTSRELRLLRMAEGVAAGFGSVAVLCGVALQEMGFALAE